LNKNNLRLYFIIKLIRLIFMPKNIFIIFRKL